MLNSDIKIMRKYQYLKVGGFKTSSFYECIYKTN